MKKFFGVLMLGALVGLLVLSCGKSPNPVQPSLSDQGGASSLAKAEVYNEQQTYDIEETFFVPCGGGGAGEDIKVNATLHVASHITINANGFHAHMHCNWTDAIGIGFWTGDVYLGSSTENAIINVDGQFESGESSWVTTLSLVGPNATFTVSSLLHQTVHADGTVTGYVDNLKVECEW